MGFIPEKLKKFFIVAFITGIPFGGAAQDDNPRPWEPDPRTYIQNRAVQASVDQNLIQDSLNKEKALLRGLENRLSKTTQSAKINALRTEIRQSKNKIKDLQARLTLKIMEGKSYKELMPLSDQEIRVRLAADQSFRTRGDTVAIKNQNDIKAQSAMPGTPATKPKPEGALSEKIISQQFDPWAGLSNSALLAKQDCQFQNNAAGANPRSGMALQPEVLFNHTPEEIKKYLNGQNYLTGEAFIATEPGYTYLQLKLNIASDQALKHYGNLEKSVMVVYFVNGKELKLFNSRFDAGYVDQVRKYTTMTGVYYLEKAMVKMLMDSEVDKIRLNFSSGYEDYVVYNIDFFTRQLTCINASK